MANLQRAAVIGCKPRQGSGVKVRPGASLLKVINESGTAVFCRLLCCVHKRRFYFVI